VLISAAHIVWGAWRVEWTNIRFKEYAPSTPVCIRGDDRLRDRAQKRFEEEFRVQPPDGSVRWLRSQGRYFYPPNGEARRVLGVSVDITNRKRAEEKLPEREQRLQLAIKAGKMFAYEWDVATDKNRIVYT